jgi:3'(2'), 5'-bisphosphate nucleotidase
MPQYEQERITARDAARLAGKLCLAVRDDMLRGMAMLEKAGREPVTIADYGAQAVILQQIAARFPADGTLAEERGSEFDELASGDQKAQVCAYVGQMLGREVTAEAVRDSLDFGSERRSSRVWAVDPIDGTKGFLRGDQFAVAVALLVDGDPVVGAIACPLLPYGASGAADRGVLAIAEKGGGVTIEPLSGPAARPASVSAQTDTSQARIVESVEIQHTDHDWVARVLERAGVGGRPVRIDSQTKYVAVADGQAEIYIRNSRTGGYRENVWDHAAGALIVSEAGGRVTDLDGKLLDFSLGTRLEANRGILATNGPVHEAILKAIRDQNSA